MHRFLLAALTLVTALGVPHVAEASRYARVQSNKLTVAQRAPLRAVVDMTFPRGSVSTVGQAIEMVLKDSGYRLAELNTEAVVLFALPLPDVHREFRQIELAALLVALGQPGYDLVVDDVNRLVTYRRGTPRAVGLSEG